MPDNEEDLTDLTDEQELARQAELAEWRNARFQPDDPFDFVPEAGQVYR